jgi:hypothetical protein
LLIGERVEEEFKVAGSLTRVIWTVREREAPVRWVAEGRIPDHGEGRLIFALIKRNREVVFKRELAYSGPNALIDRLFIRPKLIAESKASLRQLKSVLESA